MRFEEEEINKREKRENHAQHNTNINDARSLKVLKMRVLFLKPSSSKRVLLFLQFFKGSFAVTRVGLFRKISQHLKEEKSRG